MKWNIVINPAKPLLVLYVLLISSLAIAAPTNQQLPIHLVEKLDSALEIIRDDNDVPALAVGVIENGKIAYQRGFGLTSSDQAVTDKTKFRIASITKLFTAQAIMQLVEQGKLSLNDDVEQYLPEFKGQDISILELMTHHSGLKDKLKPKSVGRELSMKQYLQGSIDRQRRNNKSFQYSDLNFNALGAVIEAISGKPYTHYVYDHIIKPLNLTNTGFKQLNNGFLPDVEPYINGWFVRKAAKRPFDTSFAPSEGLVTNINDLLIWLNATLAQDPTLLNKQTYADMLEMIKNTEWGNIKMGLGWQVSNNADGKVIQHAGSLEGVKTLLIAYPETQRAIIILSNADELPRWEIANKINTIIN